MVIGEGRKNFGRNRGHGGITNLPRVSINRSRGSSDETDPAERHSSALFADVYRNHAQRSCPLSIKRGEVEDSEDSR